jgi:hypothetical protein
MAVTVLIFLCYYVLWFVVNGVKMETDIFKLMNTLYFKYLQDIEDGMWY